MHRGNVVNPSAIVWIKNTKARELDDGYPHGRESWMMATARIYFEMISKVGDA
jgi:hypothetical protein